jgi:peptide/nickel transport system substrate-binding protein
VVSGCSVLTIMGGCFMGNLTKPRRSRQANRDPHSCLPTLSRRAFIESAVATAGLVGASSFVGHLSAVAAQDMTAKRGGSLRVAMSDGTSHDTLDPRSQVQIFEIMVVGLLYDSLIVNDNGFQAKPALATSWETSTDGKVWTFHLRKGVEFHDGSKFTAKDVLYSIRLMIGTGGKAEASPLVKTLGKILQPDNVKALDDYTVRLTLNEPNVFLLLDLGSRFGCIVKEGFADFSGKAVGTGPFMLQEFTPGQSLTAVRNPHYWANGRPYLDKVVVTNIPDQASKVQTLLADQVDAIDNIDYALAGRLKSSSSHQPIPLNDADWQPVVMDPRKNPVFKDQRVIKAIKMAINRPELVKTVFAGFATVGNDTPIPSSDPYSAGLTPPLHDVAGARSLLKEAGYSKGLDLQELTVAPLVGSMVNLAVAITQQLSEVGIRVNVKQAPVSTFWDQVWQHNAMYVSDFQRRHPDEIFNLLFVSSKGSPAPWSETGLISPELDDAVRRARATTDFAKQKEAYVLVQKILTERDSHLVVAHDARIWGASRKVHGMRVNFVTHCDYSNAWIS